MNSGIGAGEGTQLKEVGISAGSCFTRILSDVWLSTAQISFSARTYSWMSVRGLIEKF
jgi:hypothetical protein